MKTQTIVFRFLALNAIPWVIAPRNSDQLQFVRLAVLTIGFGLVGPPGLCAQEPPKVVSLVPEHQAADVDPGKTKTLTVKFNQAMGKGMSPCGGGPNFPTIKSAAWKDSKTLVIKVELEPDHDYHMSLNCRSFKNFTSAKGVILEPVAWSFTTLPSVLPNQVEQKERNLKAFDLLQKKLAEAYSYYDLRIKDWDSRFKEAKPALLAAKTDAAWASIVARMLKPTNDIHMQLRFGERSFGVGARAIDPLYRRDLLEKYVEVKSIGNELALYGRTNDNIGYLMIAGWSKPLDLDGIDRALGELRDCRAVIVDVRPNAGGDEMMARRVAAWFVPGTKTYAKHRFRERAGEDGFGPIQERQITGNEDRERQFTGPIAVLTSRYVMSSNESFVMMLKQARDCTVIGQPTFGSSGNPKPHELGNGVTIVMPSWQDLRIDGTCIEGEGLAPDVLVAMEEKDLEGADPILERAFVLMRDKAGK